MQAPLTLDEAAAFLRCHPSTLKRRVARGEIAVIRRGRLLFLTSDLTAYLDGGRSESRVPVPAEDAPRQLRTIGPAGINPLTGKPHRLGATLSPSARDARQTKKRRRA